MRKIIHINKHLRFIPFLSLLLVEAGCMSMGNYRPNDSTKYEYIVNKKSGEAYEALTSPASEDAPGAYKTQMLIATVACDHRYHMYVVLSHEFTHGEDYHSGFAFYTGMFSKDAALRKMAFNEMEYRAYKQSKKAADSMVVVTGGAAEYLYDYHWENYNKYKAATGRAKK